MYYSCRVKLVYNGILRDFALFLCQIKGNTYTKYEQQKSQANYTYHTDARTLTST
jgi:hypothetical protein